MFHEIDQDRIDRVRGMDITVVTTADDRRRGAGTVAQARLPFRRTDVAKTALINKANRKPKFAVRAYTRCQRCGRPHSVYRKSAVPNLPARDGPPGELPGVAKSSW